MVLAQRWNLDALYDSFAGAAFQQDLAHYETMTQELQDWGTASLAGAVGAGAILKGYLERKNRLFATGSRLNRYATLVLSVDSACTEAKGYLERLEKLGAELAGVDTRFARWLNDQDDWEGVIAGEPVADEHRFYLAEIRAMSRYRLTEAEELVIARLKTTGSSAWTKLRESLTANLLIDVELAGEKQSLAFTQVRNLAYDERPVVRKAAYQAELSAYGKVEEAVAACLNGVKGEVITLCHMRGFASPLDQTLQEARMDETILTALLTAVRESLPRFTRYFRAKAALLGHSGGLPFYDLFAPVGAENSRFRYDEARDFIVRHFYGYSDKMGRLAERAFDGGWIDAEPRSGKVGGAFCSNLHVIGESRILANFDGNLSNVITLAHELGHAYHGLCLAEVSGLNSRYTMPIAETASTFCEMIVKQAAMASAGSQEKLFLLEKDLCGASQIIVDIYSRFLFETDLFRRRQQGPLDAAQLQAMMLTAQREAYGEGLDENFLHSGAWIAKPHYYMAQCNFYNFPYAFGLLLARGLYAQYRQRGAAFVPDYDRLLAATGKNSLAAVGRMAGIDLADTSFWRQSLAEIGRDIDEFVALADESRRNDCASV